MPRKRSTPFYNPNAGYWKGGDTHTLYAFVDNRTGHVAVHPGLGGRGKLASIGPEVHVRVATRDEAERLWQSPLHHGWKVQEPYHIGSESHRYKQLLRSVTRAPHFSRFEADSLTGEIGRAYKHNKITDEERDLLAAFLDARR